MKRCKLCGKDLSDAVKVLGESAVTVMHQNAHIDEAIRGLIDASDRGALELAPYVEALRTSVAWRLEYDETEVTK